MQPKDSDRHENIETYFYYNIKFLSYMGINTSMSGDRNVKQNHLKKVPSLIILIIELYLSVSEPFAFKEAILDKRYVEAYQIITEILSNVLVLSKGLRMITATAQINSLLEDLTIVWQKNLPGHRIRHQIIEEANRTHSFCKLFIVATFFGILIWSAPLFSNLFALYINRNSANYTFDYTKKNFFIKYPFDIRTPLRYFLVNLEEECLLPGCGLFWICTNTLFAQTTTHVSLQFKILRHDFESLINEESSDSALKRKFAHLVERHNFLLGLCNRIENLFSLVVLIMVVTSALNICFNTYTVLQLIDDENYDAILNYASLFVIVLLELSFYCVFAERLTESTSSIADGILYSKWADKNYKLGMYLQMVTIRSQRPCYCTAYKFFPIGHMRLATVLQASISYFMMFRAIA